MLTMIASLLGMILGTAGFTISLLNYLRDRPRLQVSLQWNMIRFQTGEVQARVMVANIGRRPCYVSAAALESPDQEGIMILMSSMPGKKIAEGDKPVSFFLEHKVFDHYEGRWWKFRAFVEDSTGKRWYSKKFKENDEAPAWARL